MNSVKRTSMKTKRAKMRQVALRLPEPVVEEADRIGEHVRGGRSEVLRRAVDEGMPRVDFFARAAMKTS